MIGCCCGRHGADRDMPGPGALRRAALSGLPGALASPQRPWVCPMLLHSNVCVLCSSLTWRTLCYYCRRREESGAILGRRWARTGRSPCSGASQVRHVTWQQRCSVSSLPLLFNRPFQSMLVCPGIGEFQCYDRFMLDSLRAAAEAAGHPEWYVALYLMLAPLSSNPLRHVC